MQDIPNYATFTQMEQIDKGWSGEEKYYVENALGERFLLRMADASKLGRKQLEFALMEQAFSLGVPMSQPVHVGLCREDKCTYSLFTWCDGEDAEAVLLTLSQTEQYKLGIAAGEILRLLHSILAPLGCRAWDTYFNTPGKNSTALSLVPQLALHLLQGKLTVTLQVSHQLFFSLF